MDYTRKLATIALLSLLIPSAFAAGPHPCAKQLDDASLSRLSKEELVSDICSSLLFAQIAQAEGEMISNQIPSSAKSDADKKKWVDLTAKGMFSLAERDMCVKKAKAYWVAYRSKFGTDPNCAHAPNNK
jgi:hypothetical protein